MLDLALTIYVTVCLTACCCVFRAWVPSSQDTGVYPMLTAVQIIMEKFVGHRFYRVEKVSAKELQYCRNYHAKV